MLNAYTFKNLKLKDIAKRTTLFFASALLDRWPSQ